MTVISAPSPETLARYERGPEILRQALVEIRRVSLLPPPRLSLSEWAQRYAVLSKETSASHGKFRAFAYQNGIMDAVTDPTVETITVMKSARVGYTKILDHVAAFFIHQDPSPLLIVQPRVEDAEDYSTSEIAPMLRDTPVLAEIAGDLKAKDSNQRILKRVFKNGASLTFVGANSPGGFRRITARVVAFDEVDGYPPAGAGDEGDQIKLGKKRTESFWNRKIILGSTPAVKVTSRIFRSWETSDQRRYYVPCPHCGHKQTLKWSGIRWEAADPKTAHYVCEANGCIIEEHDKAWMVDKGEWIAEKPFNGHAGFHIWAGYSLFVNAAWPKLVEEFLSVKGNPLELKTFVNLVLGEPWEERGEEIDLHTLQARATAENWQSEESTGDLLPQPAGVLLTTCGVDVQGDRLEVERVGWGINEESWSIQHHVIYGDPSSPEIWEELDDYLLTPILTEDGRELSVAATCIDSGGHSTDAVYNFVREKTRRRVWAIKGQGGEGKPVWPKLASKNNKGRIALFNIGVDAAKDMIYGRLRVDKPGPGYCHFPVERDGAWFEQLTSEAIVTKYVKGFPTRIWVPKPNTRQEGLDCRVYAFAALRSMSINWGKIQRIIADQKLAARRREVVEEEIPASPSVAVNTPRQPKRTVSRSSFLGR